MKRKSRQKPYKVVGAYDSETTNIHSVIGASAFPILHQIGLTNDITKIDNSNVERLTELHLFRHTFELCAFLDDYMEELRDFVPVIMCHNLSFDMWPLSEWLTHHNTRVLAKSRQKPITFTIRDDEGNPLLVIWDTLQFSGQSLERMGANCGYSKQTGKWDYNKTRTPNTPLSADELEYAKADIYALIAWLAWWIKRNPDIEPYKLGLNVVTKTGIVRERRRVLFDQLKGNGHNQNVGRYWLFQNRTQAPKSDDELLTMHACTRGGLTFCASTSASIPYDLRETGYKIAGFDAISQHPAQICSHRYPVGFHETNPETLTAAFELASETTLDHVLDKWSKPFPRAFNACFEFENIRPKAGSIFAENGIYPLASARFAPPVPDDDTDNETAQNFKAEIYQRGYTDTAINPYYLFGKLVKADKTRVWITELEAWLIGQCYDFDSVKAISGYSTGRFVRPSDMATLSVMQFYRAKNAFKRAKNDYEHSGTLSVETIKICKDAGIVPTLIEQMKKGELSDDEVATAYQVYKSDLNALFGIEASNEYRQDTVLDETGIEYEGEAGIENAPKNPKTWYQMGQRIVGWSRVAQIVVMLLSCGIAERIINGDTDSVKFLVRVDCISALESALDRYSQALDNAKHDTLLRAKLGYPRYYDELKDIGHYELEFESECFCASWNKAYCTYDVDPRDNQRHFKFTLAGIPANRGLNKFADMLSSTMGFGEVCDIALGYDVTLSHALTRLNARAFPEWQEIFNEWVDGEHVVEPAALAIYPMAKTVNALTVPENRANYQVAKLNRPSVNGEPIILTWTDGEPDIIKLGDIVDGY